MKQINLNSDSITTHLYKWYYNKSRVNDLPSNLLIYSLQVILMYLSIIPLYLFIFPYEIYEKYNLHTRRSTIDKICYVIIFYIILSIACVITTSLFISIYLLIEGHLPFFKTDPLYSIYIIGIILDATIISWYIAYLFKIVYEIISKKLSKFVYRINWITKTK